MEYYRKLIVAIAGVVAAIGTALADWHVDAQEAGVIAGAIAVAIGVRQVRNRLSVEQVAYARRRGTLGQ